MRSAIARRLRHIHIVGGGESAVLQKFRDRVCRCDNGGRLPRRHTQVEIAPVDTEVVARAVEHLLITRADVEQGEAAVLRASPGDRLVVGIDSDATVYIEQEIDLVTAAVGGLDSPCEIGDGAREQIEVLGKGGREELDSQADPASLKDVGGAGGLHVERVLLHRRDSSRIGTHITVGDAIDSHEAGEGLLGARPVSRGIVGKMVRHRPDAEIRIVRDERNGGRAGLLGAERNGSEREK